MEIPATHDKCVVNEHILPDQTSFNTEKGNAPDYDADYTHKGKSFLEVFGNVYEIRASAKFICYAIEEKTNKSPEFEKIFSKLYKIASEASSYSTSPTGRALGHYTDTTYVGEDWYDCSVPYGHCVWFSCEHKYRRTDTNKTKLCDASVDQLLVRLKSYIERAIAVITAATTNNKLYCVLDREVMEMLKNVRLQVQQLIQKRIIVS